MILTKQCACGQKVEFEAEDLPSLNCPSCGRSLHDQFASPAPWLPTRESIMASFEVPKIKPAPSLTQSTLDSVRSQSCYKTLRGLIETVIGIGLVILGLTIVAAIFGLVSDPDNAAKMTAAILLAAMCALGFVVLIAIKQAFLLGIDAVDTLIADRANRQADKAARRQNALAEFTATTDK